MAWASIVCPERTEVLSEVSRSLRDLSSIDWLKMFLQYFATSPFPPTTNGERVLPLRSPRGGIALGHSSALSTAEVTGGCSESCVITCDATCGAHGNAKT